MRLPRCKKFAGRSVAFDPEMTPGLGAPPFFAGQKNHAAPNARAATNVGQIQKGSLEGSSSGFAARVGLPGTGAVGRGGMAPVGREDGGFEIRCETEPLTVRTWAEVGARGTELVGGQP